LIGKRIRELPVVGLDHDAAPILLRNEPYQENRRRDLIYLGLAKDGAPCCGSRASDHSPREPV
jgi:hypothetical protein